MVTQIPAEVAHFEALLNRPNSDPTGLAGFFNSGQILVARVPARLDVIGGIADYSGANVCEGVLGRGMVIALQPRTDRTLRIRTLQANRKSLPIETRIPLAYFELGEGFVGYEEIRELCRANPLSTWAAYIGGSIFTLLKEESVRLPYGFSLLLLSGVPMNVGIGSSAATEIDQISLNSNADFFAPDRKPLKEALGRTTHLAIGAHSDDLEIMAYHGIAECFGRSDRWSAAMR